MREQGKDKCKQGGEHSYDSEPNIEGRHNIKYYDRAQGKQGCYYGR